MEEKTIRIKYHSSEIDRLCYIDGKSDWIDLRAAEEVTLKKGEFAYISLGISVSLPEGYEMIIAPRSSTYKNCGISRESDLKRSQVWAMIRGAASDQREKADE